MNGLCITDAVKQFGITSKTLRYYERVGLLEANRVKNNNYRSYNESEVERIKQILVLRKMQISIKDIIRIYENEDMSTVVEVFVNRINTIDEEVGVLTELRRITNDFLQTMVENGITKISAIPLLYEEMDKQLTEMEERKSVTISELDDINQRLLKHKDYSIVDLPPMRVLSSVRKDNHISEANAFWDYLQKNNIPIGLPGQHELFEYQTDEQTIFMQKIANDYENNSPFEDSIFYGGLFAFAYVYVDEDLGGQFRALIKDFNGNKYYQIDYQSDGSLRHVSMLENLISLDDQRELVALLVPVKKRMADPALFNKSEEVIGVSVLEIEAANPVLWEVDVSLDKLTPINKPHYRITDIGEAEFVGGVIRAVLSTNISVKLPFRVDIEFRQSDECGSGLVCYHGEETGYHAGGYLGGTGFGINMNNSANQLLQAIRFNQPIFLDGFNFPGRGAIKAGVYNRLTWIVGEKHLAAIINDEIRYCGVNFPYMSLDLSHETAYPIVIGSHGEAFLNDKKYFRSIRVSQLAETKKNKLKKGELTMITKQSNNIIPVIHRLVTDEYGENYWFNGCACYVMECLGEKDYDYWFFAGLTGDVFTQHYYYSKYSGDAVSCYMMSEKPVEYTEEIFAKCGYAATFVSKKELLKNTEMYLQTLIAYIDKGIPVIMWGNPEGVFVGYEDYGKVLLYITGNNNQPERMPLEKALDTKPNSETAGTAFERNTEKEGWIFVGDKKENRPLAEIYREAIRSVPQYQSVKTDAYCFGAEAFRAWARDIENGKFDGMKPEDFDTWAYYTNYVCVLATNGFCCYRFLDKARELNPDMEYLEEISRLYERICKMWNNDNGTDLEALGGGFNITLEALQDKERRGKIAAKIREFADVTDEIVRVLRDNL